MTGGLRATHSGESAHLCKLHTVRCTSYYLEMQCKAPSFCRSERGGREKREWLGFNLSRVRQQGHNPPYTLRPVCKMFTNLHKCSLHNGHSLLQGHNILCTQTVQTFLVYWPHDSLHKNVAQCAKLIMSTFYTMATVCGRDTTSCKVVVVQI